MKSGGSVGVVGDRVRYSYTCVDDVPAKPHMIVLDAFDFEHVVGRHRKYFWSAELIERGGDFIVVEFGQRLFGVRFPPHRFRVEYQPPFRLTFHILQGPLVGLRVAVDAAPPSPPEGAWSLKPIRHRDRIGTQTLEVEIPRVPGAKLVLAGLRPLLDLSFRAMIQATELLKQADYPAWAVMLEAMDTEDYVANGMRILGPVSGKRVRRLSVLSLVRGCADCGRYDLGFEHGGVVRCASCDFEAIHSGSEHEVLRTGSEITCRCSVREAS